VSIEIDDDRLAVFPFIISGTPSLSIAASPRHNAFEFVAADG
jgi:hypothetical protein